MLGTEKVLVIIYHQAPSQLCSLDDRVSLDPLAAPSPIPSHPVAAVGFILFFILLYYSILSYFILSSHSFSHPKVT